METQHTTTDLGSLTIRDIFFKYVRFLPVFLVAVAFTLLIAYLYLRYTTPIFRATGTISFISENSSRGDKFSEIFVANQTNDIEAEMEVLKSASLMQRVIDAAQLQTNYYAIGKIKTLNVTRTSPFTLDILRLNDSSRNFSLNVDFVSENGFRINNEKQVFKPGDVFENFFGVFRIDGKGAIPAGKAYNVTWTPSAMLAPQYASMIRVAPKVAGSLIHNISIDISNPSLGVVIINNLIRQYQLINLEYRNQSSEQTLVFIEKRLGLLEKDLDSIERKLLLFKQRYNLIDLDQQSKDYFGTMKETDKAVNEQRVNLKVVDLIEDYLRDKNNLFEKVPSSLGIDNEIFQKLVGEYNLKISERKTLIEGGAKLANPAVRKLESQIEEIRKNIFEALKSTRRLFQTIIDNSAIKGSSAEAELRVLPERAKDLLEIQRDKDIKQSLYKLLLEKREETAMSKESNIPNSKVLSYAVSSEKPIKPNRTAIQLMAFVLGLGLPAMFIFFMEIVNDKVNTRFDIEKITDASILGEVGHSYSSSSMVVSKTNRSMVAEQFRIIRSNLQYVLNKIERPTIMVTSSFSGEGKSFVASNLGGVMALAGKKTVILEFDIRKPKLMSGLKLKSAIGITSFLVGKSKAEELPIQVPGFDSLYVIACGPVPPNPSELLLDSRVAELFDWLKNNFDTIIIDTAPVGMVSDAMTLGAFADATLYIARQGHTYKKQVAMIDEFYRENKLPRISIIINDVKLKPGYGYYGYGRYGYGYGYSGGYYEAEEDNRSLKDRIISPKWMRKFKKHKES